MPTFERIALADIDEPNIASRSSMSRERLDSLKIDLAAQGQLQPIGLVRCDLRYRIEYGHRRFVAASELGWHDIMALVFAPGELAEGAAMLSENLEREELNAADEAVFMQRTMERFKLDEDGLCARFRRSKDYIADRFRLLRGDPKIFEALQDGVIGFTTARELNKCGDEVMRGYFLHQAIAAEASGRTVSRWVADWRLQGSNSPALAQPAAPTNGEAPPPAHPVACEFCGGHLDPYNLEMIWVHKYELAQIRSALQSLAH